MGESTKTKAQLVEEIGRLQRRLARLENTSFAQQPPVAEEEMRALFEQASDGIFLTDQAGFCLDVNDRACQMLGWPREEILQMHLQAFAQKKDLARLQEELEGLIAGGLATGEWRVRRKDGQPVTVEISAKKLSDGRLQVILHDLSERKRSELERIALQRLSQQLTAPLSMRDIGARVAKACLDLFHYDCFWFSRYDSQNNRLMGIYIEDTPDGHKKPIPMPFEEAVQLTKVFPLYTTGKAKLINRNDLPKKNDLVPFGVTTRMSHSLMFAPVRWEGKIVGVISAQSYIPYRYGERDLELLQMIADQCGGALARIRAELALREAHAELEKRVQERTFELAKANKDLQFEISERERAEELLRYRLILEQSLEQISRMLAYTDEPDMEQVLEILGQAVDVNRVYVFHFQEDLTRVHLQHEWCSPGLISFQSVISSIDITQYPWWLRCLQKERKLVIPDVERLPAEAHIERALYQQYGIRSLMNVALLSETGEITGFIGLADTRKRRMWSAEEVRFLRLVGEMLSRHFERKASRLQLHQLATALESAGEGILIVDPSGIIRYVNSAFEQITGYTRQEALGLSLDALRSSQGEHDFSSALEYPNQGVNVWRSTFINRKQDGTLYYVEGTLSPIHDSAGKVISYVAVMRDITERILAEKELERLSHQKDEFIRIASHDLKNYLTSIQGINQVIQTLVKPGKQMPEQMHSLLDRISDSALNMYNIILDFLDFQAMEDGRLILNKEPMDLNDVCRQHLEGIQGYAKSKKTTLCLEPMENLPIVQADPFRIGQVIQNLVSNAIKFSPTGARVIIRTLRDADCIRLEVQDNGPGLQAEDFQKVFGKYVRLSNSPTGEEKSTGLGLAICKQLIDLHGGDIGVRNNPDKGTTFWFCLPSPS